MKEQVFENPMKAFTAAPEPHFDDERTILSARPVVPLKDIRRVRHRKYWLLGGAFAIAIMLGAASAMLPIYLKQESVDKPAAVVSRLESPQPEGKASEAEMPGAMDVEEASESYPSAVENTDAQSTRRVAAEKQSPLAERRRMAVKGDSGANQPIGRPELSEDDELQRIREEVLTDRWQERRLRRAVRRDRLRSNRDGRDLSHVDEIFEGLSRPQ